MEGDRDGEEDEEKDGGENGEEEGHPSKTWQAGEKLHTQNDRILKGETGPSVCSWKLQEQRRFSDV